MLDRLHDNDAGLTAELLHGSVVQCRNRIALDWDNAWRLDTGGSDRFDREVIDVSVRFAARIPVRPVRLIAEGCGLSRAEVERLITEETRFGNPAGWQALRRLHLHAQALSPPRDPGPVRQIRRAGPTLCLADHDFDSLNEYGSWRPEQRRVGCAGTVASDAGRSWRAVA
ncbi:DUF1062 domain-containing protein [Dactylosporangium darangshiense]|uniref:DUF1062 domain-containing protein n=1 Tax=Dactylosporangium darangshiense TaxID=579108 RepID=UPI0036273F2D